MKKERADPESGVNRRDFLISAALGAGMAATLSGCGSKEEKLIPLLVSEDRLIPGVDRWTPSTCALCPAGCSVMVRTMLGEAKVRHDGQNRRQMAAQVKKMEGNTMSPINRGRLCVRGQAAPQMTYNPDRIQTPLRSVGPRGSGRFQPISWNEALSLVEGKLTEARNANTASKLAAICGTSSRMRRRLLQEFLSATGSSYCFTEEISGVPTLRLANERLFGRRELEVHDLERCRYLMSFGADFIEAHTSPVRYSLGLAGLRRGRPGERGKFVQAESRFSLTAANADEWLPLRPGTEASLALAMSHVILKEKLYDRDFIAAKTLGYEAYRSRILAEYEPEKVAKIVDLPAKQIIRVAREFARHRPAIALAGGSALAQRGGLFTAMAVQSLNALVGSFGVEGGVCWSASSARIAADVPAVGYWAENFVAAADSISALILWDANPVYGSPASLELRKSLQKIPFIVAFALLVDESAVNADLILPDQTFLEHWDVSEPEVTAGARILSITQPIIRPLYESRDRADVLLELAARWGGKMRAALPDNDFKEYLRRNLEHSELKKGSFLSADIDSFWDTLLTQGAWIDGAAPAPVPPMDFSRIQETEPPAASTAVSQEYPLYLQPFASAGLGTGREASFPWMQEMPDPMSSVVWGSWAEINPQTAVKLGVQDGEWIWLESPSGRVRIPAMLQHAARPDTVSIPFGQGHESYGRYASGRGANPWQLLSSASVSDVGEPAWASVRVRVVRTGEKAGLIKLGYDRERTPAEMHR